MSKPKHYRPAGKKVERNAAKYITRSKAIRYLQTNLANFRKLCILKGISPRVPKKKFEGTSKTYYDMKDIKFILHEPLLEKFRVRRAYDKKEKKALAKKNKVAVDRLISRKPTYILDRIILERYPQFVDALRDLDDSLTRIHLFSSLSATASESIDVKQIHLCQRLCLEWQAYISQTHSLRKTFVSVKGIYYEAEVQGQKILWLVPHALQQVFLQDVDDKTLINFLQFDVILLTFVNYKLYHSIGAAYPPTLDPQSQALAADLCAYSRHFGVSSTATSKQSLDVSEADFILDKNQDAVMDKETKKYGSLFKNLKIFLSREVPHESLLFVISAFGGLVSWDGEGAPFEETDEGITHQIVDKPTLGHIFLSRDYVQPQWVYDCTRTMTLLPTSGYAIGRHPPKHLSPFVDYKEEDDIEKENKLQGAAKEDARQTAEDDEKMSRAVLPRRSRGLYEAIQINRRREAEHVRFLQQRRSIHLARLSSGNDT